MNKSVLITGASRGIGAATAGQLLKADNAIRTIVLMARDSGDYAKLVDNLKNNNPFNKDIVPVIGDVGSREDLIRNIDDIYSSVGNVDLLINNAGYTNPVPIHQIDFSDFEKTMSVNLYGPFTLVQSLLQKGNRFDVIVNVASTAGITGRSGWLTYSASKAALINMSQVMQEELSIYGTRVVCISPGRTATALRKTLAPDEDPSTIMQPEHVADVIGTLISPVGRYITSENIVVRL